MKTRKWIWLPAALAAFAAVVLWFLTAGRPAAVPTAAEDGEELSAGDGAAEEAEPDPEDGEASGDDDGSDAGEMDEDDRQAAEAERLVDAFDGLTDKWMEQEGGEVTLRDVDEFVARFKAVPKDRQEECLQRALNLISDEHVLLLAGVLFDKTVDKEQKELVFNDVLNRDEEVKKLILPRIYKDRTHPCWADAAWILDVTGELPKGKTE